MARALTDESGSSSVFSNTIKRTSKTTPEGSNKKQRGSATLSKGPNKNQRNVTLPVENADDSEFYTSDEDEKTKKRKQLLPTITMPGRND
jgi:hypothetical protein